MENKNISERILLLIIAGIQFSHILDFMIMMPLGPMLMDTFNINPSRFGVLVSAYTFSACIFGLVAGFYADRFDRKKYLLFNYIGFALGTGLCAIASNFYLLLIGRLVAGAFGGILTSCVYSIIGDLIPKERRGKALGVVMGSFSVASVVGVPTALYLANIYNWSAPFYLVLALTVILFGTSYLNLPSIAGHLNKESNLKIKTYIELIFVPVHFFSLLVIFFMMHGSFSVIPYISAFLVKNVGVPQSDIPYVYLVGGIFTIVTSRFIGKLSDKFSNQKIFLSLSILAMLPIIKLTTHSPASIWVVLLTTVPFMIFISGRMIPLMNMITRAADNKTRGAFMSVVTATQHISTASASLIGGSIIKEGAGGYLNNYNQVGIFSVVSILVSIVISFNLLKLINKKESEHAVAIN